MTERLLDTFLCHYIHVYYVLVASKGSRTDVVQRQLLHSVCSFYSITDYEVAMRNALQNVWEAESDKIQGCYWHLCRLWVGKIADITAQ